RHRLPARRSLRAGPAHAWFWVSCATRGAPARLAGAEPRLRRRRRHAAARARRGWDRRDRPERPAPERQLPLKSCLYPSSQGATRGVRANTTDCTRNDVDRQSGFYPNAPAGMYPAIVARRWLRLDERYASDLSRG